jgi:phage gp29-like protein
MEDSPFEEPRFAGSIHGVGVRSKIYWTWYAMTECLQRVLEYLDRSSMGVEIWKFPANNPRAEEKVRQAAIQHVGGGRSIVLCPVYPGEQADMYGVEHIEPGMAGVDSILNVIKEFFGHKIKRYICGQTLTSEAESTGLGSGVADAHLATFADIISYDARNLEETLTEDFLRPIQTWNFPRSQNIYMRFVIDTESDNPDKKLEALKNAWDMGMRIKASDIADAVGCSVPGDDEKQVFNPQIVGAMDQMTAGEGKKSFEESIAESYYKAVGVSRG